MNFLGGGCAIKGLTFLRGIDFFDEIKVAALWKIPFLV